MARSKNSPALFEVIRSAQQKQKEQAERQRLQELNAAVHAHSPAAALLRSPIYWFKGKHAHQAAIEGPDLADADLPVMREVPKARTPVKAEFKPAATPVSTPQKAAEPKKIPAASLAAAPVAPIVAAPAPVAPAPVAQVVTEPTPAPFPDYSAPIYAPAPSSHATESASQVREKIVAAQEAPAAEPLFHIPAHDEAYAPADFTARHFAGHDEDEDDQPQPPLFNLRFNYTTASIAAFAILTAFTVAYVIGNHNQAQRAKADQSTNPAPTKQVQAVAQNTGKRPDVLNVRPGEAGRTYSSVPTPTTTPPADDVRANVPNTGDSLALDTVGKPIAVPTNVKRIVGVQYLVLLSFPREEDAKELVKFLAQNGVPATAEKALPDYAKSWTSVVTTRGFDHTKNNPAFTTYSNTLSGLLKKYAGENGFKKSFKIDLYTWRTAR